MSDTQTIDTPSTQSAPAPNAAPATTEESTLLGSKSEGAPEGGDKTLLGEQTQKDGAAEGGKKEDAKTEQSAVPEKYEFKMPEGLKLDEKAVEEFTPILKEIGLDQAKAQKLVEKFATWDKARTEAHQQEAIKYFQGIVKEWRDQTIKELGEGFAQQKTLAAQAIDKANIPGLREMMDETGVGNHPALVKFMAWVGKMVAPDSYPDSGIKRPALTTDEDKARVIYG